MDWISVDRVRERIHQISDMVPQGAGGYVDRDVIAAAPLAPTLSGRFSDMDDIPLNITATEALAQPGARPGCDNNQHKVSAREAGLEPEKPDVAPSEDNEDEAIAVNPALLRHVIYAATALPGTEPAYAKTQIQGTSLVYGIGKFRQDDGTLGRLLTMMNDADQEAFGQIFEHADELLAVTNAPYNGEENNQRLQDVSGARLAERQWIDRFKHAAALPEFQDMQLKATAVYRTIPLLEFSRNVGLDTPRGLALLTERALQNGVDRAMEIVLDAISPLNVPMVRNAVLETVIRTNPSLIAFQRDENIEPPDGQFNLPTHVRLFARLRELEAPPVQVPSLNLMYDQIVRAASRSTVQGLASAIRESAELKDTRLSDTPPTIEQD